MRYYTQWRHNPKKFIEIKADEFIEIKKEDIGFNRKKKGVIK